MANKLVGYNGDATLGGTAMKVTEWSGSLSSEEIDITSKASAGWKEFQLGITKLEGSFKALWDKNIGGTGVPPYAKAEPQEGVLIHLQIGDQTATLTGVSYLSFTGIISSLEITSAVAGAIEYTCSFKSTGAVTHTIL